MAEFIENMMWERDESQHSYDGTMDGGRTDVIDD